MGIDHRSPLPQLSRDSAPPAQPQPLAAHVEADELAREEQREHREGLLAQLLFAAKDLAEAQIEPADGDEPAFCNECVVDQYENNLAHEPLCRTGRVLRVLSELCKLNGGAR